MTTSKSITQSRSNLFKEMIDKQQTAILNTREGKFFVRKNHFILGTYLLFDSTDAQCYDESYIPNHHIRFQKYTDPTISMYAIIMKKPIFLESLLNIQHELFKGKKKFDKIKIQGLRKVNILDLSIESYSDECLDIILKFFDEHNIKYEITYYFRYALLHKNEYAFKVFSKKLIDKKISIKEYFKNNDEEYQHFLKLHIPFKMYESKTVNEYLRSLNIEIPSKISNDIANKDYQNLLNIRIPVTVFSPMNMSEYLTKNGLNDADQQDAINQNDTDTDKSNSMSTVSNQDPQSDITGQDTKRCKFGECKADGIETCPRCKKMFCIDHINDHGCT